MNKKYIGYCRISTEEQMNGFGIDAQRTSIESYANALGYELAAMYYDEGYSGANGERPALQEIMALIETGDYSGVIVMKLDRLSRNLKDILNWHDDIFLTNNASIISVKEQFDTSTAIGRLFFQMIGGFSEFEKEVIKERMVGGKKEKAKKGGFAGGATPYGYNNIDKELVINEEQAIWVRKVFELRNTGSTLQVIADYLNENGAKTKRGGKWSKVHVRDMLNREDFYKGEYQYDDIKVKGQHEAILN